MKFLFNLHFFFIAELHCNPFILRESEALKFLKHDLMFNLLGVFQIKVLNILPKYVGDIKILFLHLQNLTFRAKNKEYHHKL